MSFATFEELWGLETRLVRPRAPLADEQLGHVAVSTGDHQDRNLFRLPRDEAGLRELLLARVRELQGLADTPQAPDYDAACDWIRETCGASADTVQADTANLDHRVYAGGPRKELPRGEPARPHDFQHSAMHQALCNVYPRRVFRDILPVADGVVRGDADLYVRLKALVTDAGFPWDEGRVHVVALRACQDGAVHRNRGVGYYDNRFNDTFIVAWRGEGQVRCWEVLATADPGGEAGERTQPDTDRYSETTFAYGAGQQLCFRYARTTGPSSKAGRPTHGPRPGASPERSDGLERRHCIDLEWPGMEATIPGTHGRYQAWLRLRDPGASTQAAPPPTTGRRQRQQTPWVDIEHGWTGPQGNKRALPAADVPASAPHLGQVASEHLYSSLRYHNGADGAIGQRRSNNALHSSASLGRYGDEWVRGDSMGCLVVNLYWYGRFCMEIERGLDTLLIAQEGAAPGKHTEFVVTILDARNLLARARMRPSPLRFDEDDLTPEQERLQVDLDALREEWEDSLLEAIREAHTELDRSSPESASRTARRLSELRDAVDGFSSQVERLRGQVERMQGGVEAAQALIELVEAADAFDRAMDPTREDYAPASIVEKAQQFSRLGNAAAELVDALPLPATLTESFTLLVQSGTTLLEAGARVFQSYHGRIASLVHGEGSSSVPRGLTAIGTASPRALDYYYRKLGGGVFLVEGTRDEVSLGLRQDARQLGSILMRACESRAVLPARLYGAEEHHDALRRAWQNLYIALGCQEDEAFYEDGMLGGFGRWVSRLTHGGDRTVAPAGDGLLGTWIGAVVTQTPGQYALRYWANPMRILMRETLRLLSDPDELHAAVRLFESGPSAALGEADLARDLSEVSTARAMVRALLSLPLRRMRVSSVFCPLDTLLETLPD